MVVLSEFAFFVAVSWSIDYCAALGGTQLAVSTESLQPRIFTQGEASVRRDKLARVAAAAAKFAPGST
jgi:hypothetical protein